MPHDHERSARVHGNRGSVRSGRPDLEFGSEGHLAARRRGEGEANDDRSQRKGAHGPPHEHSVCATVAGAGGVTAGADASGATLMAASFENMTAPQEGVV